MAKKVRRSKTAGSIRENPRPPEEVLAGQEGEDDLVNPSVDIFRQAVLWGTDWTTETLMSQVSRSNIDLEPDFQRRDVWSVVKKSRFIESLFLGLPIPQIVLAERKDARGRFIVLDGKQRILALTQFMKPTGDPLELTDLTVLRQLEGRSYESLDSDPTARDQVSAFQNQTIRTVIFRQWPTEDFLRLVFYRLNSNTVTLSPQELRQALFPGPFTRYANRRSAKSTSLVKALRQDGPDFRMRDVELFVRFFANRLFLMRYSGNMKKFLDDTCRELNETFGRRKREIVLMAQSLDDAIEATFAIFDIRNSFSIWREDRYEGRFNRTVFDLMTYFLCLKDIRSAALRKKNRVRAAFESLCERDEDFVRALEVTTKSIESTTTRFTTWAAALQKALPSVTVDAPRIRESS